jgi:3-oxoadipate CoA-transferase alpha subunit
LINKISENIEESISKVFDGATIMIAGFGGVGIPDNLIELLRLYGAKDLTIVHNGGGDEDKGVGGLILDGRVKKLIASFPNSSRSWAFKNLYLENKIELELVPQGSLVERIRAGGAGLGGIYTPTAIGTDLGVGKEIRDIDGKLYIFEKSLKADFSFIKAYKGDRFGNLSYRMVMKNFNLIMATAGATVIAEVDHIVSAGDISPEDIHTPGIYVDKISQFQRSMTVSQKSK